MTFFLRTTIAQVENCVFNVFSTGLLDRLVSPLLHALARLAWTCLAACWLAPAAWAAPVVQLGASDFVSLTHPSGLSEGPSLSLLRDPGQALKVEQVSAAPDSAFTPVQQLSLGFTRDAVWLKFTLQPSTDQVPGLWWLEVKQPLLEDVQLYAPDGRGGYTRIEEITAYRHPVFGLAVPARETPTFFVRLASRTAMTTPLTLWQPQALLRASTDETLLRSCIFGVYALVIVVYAAFWLRTRERIHLIYTLSVTANFLAAFFDGGWPKHLWPTSPPELRLDLMGTWLSLAMPLGALLSVSFVQQGRRLNRIYRHWLQACAAVAAVGIALVWSGHYHLAMPIVQGGSLLTMVVLAGWTVRQALQGNRAARFYIFAFTFFYVGVACRYLRNVGGLEPSFWTDSSYLIGTFIHLLVMSVGIFASYNRLRRDKEQAETRAQGESRLRLAQSDFMAMMSHEFRTPLTIVGASVDNLLDGPALNQQDRARVEKIQRAADRMRLLMDQYLASERLLLDKQVLTVAPCDLAQLCQQVQAEMADAGASVTWHVPPAARVACDGELVRVALSNLVSNAVRHSPSDQPVEVALSQTKGWAQLSVRDHGAGVPEDEIHHLFQRFFRGRSARHQPGAGLGLFMVQSIAHRHGGDVSVQNLPGGGCQFCLRLPT